MNNKNKKKKNNKQKYTFYYLQGRIDKWQKDMDYYKTNCFGY